MRRSRTRLAKEPGPAIPSATTWTSNSSAVTVDIIEAIAPRKLKLFSFCGCRARLVAFVCMQRKKAEGKGCDGGSGGGFQVLPASATAGRRTKKPSRHSSVYFIDERVRRRPCAYVTLYLFPYIFPALLLLTFYLDLLVYGVECPAASPAALPYHLACGSPSLPSTREHRSGLTLSVPCSSPSPYLSVP